MTVQSFEIPLSAQNQSVDVTLAGKNYTLVITWCSPMTCWMMTIKDSSSNSILAGVPLVTGADLLAQYEYLGIGGSMIVQTVGDADAQPTYENLGVTSRLFFIVDDGNG